MPVLVVTGGAKGIGLGVARMFAAEGWTPVIADLDAAGAEAVAGELGGDHVVVDVTDHTGLVSSLAEVARRHGGIDCLVTSAGLTVVGPSHALSADDWRKVIDVDLTGVFFTCQAAVPHIPQGGAIVNIASIAATRAFAGRAAYSAAKAGVVAITRVLAVEWVDRGIRVNAVAPGWVDTPFLQDAVDKGYVDLDALRERPPMKRLGEVDDVAGAIHFLASPAAAYVTGQTLYVDGGWVWAG